MNRLLAEFCGSWSPQRLEVTSYRWTSHDTSLMHPRTAIWLTLLVAHLALLAMGWLMGSALLALSSSVQYICRCGRLASSAFPSFA
jgi:hypothetical protein